MGHQNCRGSLRSRQGPGIGVRICLGGGSIMPDWRPGNGGRDHPARFSGPGPPGNKPPRVQDRRRMALAGDSQEDTSASPQGDALQSKSMTVTPLKPGIASPRNLSAEAGSQRSLRLSWLLSADVDANQIAGGIPAVDAAMGKHRHGPAFTAQDMPPGKRFEGRGVGRGDHQFALF